MSTVLRRRYWGYVCLWTLFIYSTIPFVRPLCEFLRHTIPFHPVVNLSFVAMLAAILAVAIIKIRKKKHSTYFLLLLINVIVVICLLKFKIAEEKIHLVEYGFLSFLIYRALRLDFSNLRAYALAFILAAFLGWMDECLQYITPGRYYDLRDIFLNILGGALGLAVTFIFEKKSAV